MAEWNLPVRCIMRTDLPRVGPGEGVTYARLLMRTRDASCVLVVGDGGGGLLGVMWERDVRTPALLDRHADVVTVAERMRTRVPQVSATTSARDALRILRESSAGCVAVTDGDTVLGLLTSADLIRRLMDGPSSAVGE